MLMQSGLFFAGSLAARWTMRKLPPARLVPIGLAFVAAGSLAMAVFLRVWEPTFLIVMAPVSLYAFGIAFIMPAMSVAAMAPFPRIAGSASSMTGFLQMLTGPPWRAGELKLFASRTASTVRARSISRCRA
jgi:DHA1 family bicyclomycin/chloramphenicol resistance-like MFS transporter